MEILLKYPEYRDNDFKLIATVWLMEMGGKEMAQTLTALDMLETFAKGHLSHSESIRRIRQKIQEQRPDLRGSRWQERQKMKEVARKAVYEL